MNLGILNGQKTLLRKKRKYKETGYHFIWENIERPDYYKYHPEKKEIK